MIPHLPARAAKIIDTIAAAGGRGYLVGGALRDLMRGKEPEDWDFAASLEPARLLEIFPGSRLIGGSCGTVQAPFGEGWCEVTPCRTEQGYTDRRHPDEVVFVPDILADLSRRDFTVNAMAFDGAVLLDPFGGQQDLSRRQLRCVGNAKERFEEDALRVLRLFRLAAQLGFTAEWDTFCAANDAMGGIAALPRERVLGEVRRILLSDEPGVLAGVIAKGGLSDYGLHFAPSLKVLNRTPKELVHRLWGLAALCGADTDVVCDAFGLSAKTHRYMGEMTRLYRLGPAGDNLSLKLKLRDVPLDYAPVAATFAAVSPAFVAEPALFAGVCKNKEPYRMRDLAVNGDMLEYQGIRGQMCGRVLQELLNAVIRNPALNRPQVLLGLARSLKQIL